MDFSLLDYHLKMDQEKVHLYYKGPFDEVILSNISKHIRANLQDYPKASKKLFAVFMELAQNISYYSAEHNMFNGNEDERGVGTVVVYEKEAAFVLTAGNLVEKTKVSEIVERSQQINQLSPDELRALKREVRSRPREEGQRGGNIGLIQVAIKSGNPLEVVTHEVDEANSFMVLSTQIDKE